MDKKLKVIEADNTKLRRLDRRQKLEHRCPNGFWTRNYNNCCSFCGRNPPRHLLHLLELNKNLFPEKDSGFNFETVEASFDEIEDNFDYDYGLQDWLMGSK